MGCDSSRCMKWNSSLALFWLEVHFEHSRLFRIAQSTDSSGCMPCDSAESITIADFFALSVLYLAVCIGADLSAFPSVRAWMQRVQNYSPAAFAKAYTPLIQWSASEQLQTQRVAKGMNRECVSWSAAEAKAALDSLQNQLKASPAPAAATLSYRSAQVAPGLVLYYSSGSAPSRAVLHFIADSKCGSGEALASKVRLCAVDLQKGEQRSGEYLQHVSARGQVPALVEIRSTSSSAASAATSEPERRRLTESSAIIRYLASAFECRDVWYDAKDVRERARSNERMVSLECEDWLALFTLTTWFACLGVGELLLLQSARLSLGFPANGGRG
jgi:glutathione S-transferase